MTRSLVPGGHYDVDVETVCHSCQALQKVQRDDEAKGSNEDKRRDSSQYKHGDGRIYTVRELRHEGIGG